MKICPACAREYADAEPRCREDGAALVQLDTASNERASDLIGQVVDGRYRIDRIVGRGGMGTVYAARHVVVGKEMAIKVLRSGVERSEEVLHRFIREAQAANAVRSRHICEMTDFGQLPTGSFFVVMELLDGISLTRALREQRLSRAQLKRVFIQISETLDKAHRANIVHRDLKPDNVVLVQDDNDPFFVKLVDFGIAKVMESKASNLTETGVILGTPYYMSPEQARGDSVDHRSDIYSMGVMMYRAFTGKLPFVADTAMGVLTRHLTQKPQLPSRVVAGIDPSIESIILRCLEKQPIDRFQSMAHVAESLRTVPDHAPRRRSDNPTFDERHPLQWSTATNVAPEPSRSGHPGTTAAPTTPDYGQRGAQPRPSAPGAPQPRASTPGAPQPRASGPGAPRPSGAGMGTPVPPAPPGSLSSGSLKFPPMMPLPVAPLSQQGASIATGQPPQAAAGHPQPGWPAQSTEAAVVQHANQSGAYANQSGGYANQSGGYANQSGGYAAASALRSGPHAAQPQGGKLPVSADGSGPVAALGTAGAAGPAGYQPEAYTTRGVVSSRLEIPQPQPTRNTGLWVGVGGAMLVILLVGGVLIAMLGDGGSTATAPSANTTATTPAAAGEDTEDGTETAADPAASTTSSAEPSASTEPSASAEPSSSASADPPPIGATGPQPARPPHPPRVYPPRPQPVRPPPPSPNPQPFQDIRSPFD